MFKKVSIIVPVHNSENTIERTAKSILQQNYADLELILIENCSTDNSYNSCLKLKSEDERVIVIKTEQQGVSAARNLGLEKASGDIITFCDADDFWCPGILERIILEFDECDCVVTGYREIYEEKIIDRLWKKQKHIDNYKMIELVLNDTRMMGSVWNKFYSKDIVKNKLFDTELAFMEDSMFNINVFMKKTSNIKIIPVISYNYVKTTDSVTKNVNLKYSSNNELKYILTTKKIKALLPHTRRNEVITGYNIFKLAMENYQKELKDTCKKRYLLNEARNNYKNFTRLILKYAPYRNFKMLIKYLCIILEIY